MSEFEHAMQSQFDRIANIGHGITPDDITESFTDIRTGHSADMQSLQKRIAELEAEVPKVVKPIYIKGLNIFNSDNVQIVVDEHYECPECGAILNLAVDSKDAKIATLEALVADYKEDLIDALQDVINYAPACTSSIEYAEKRLKELTETEK
jgi:uncharacterized coiled-coil protein SlyX